MSFFNQVYESLFGHKKDAKDFTLTHELISRSGRYLDQYQKWQANGDPDRIFGSVRSAYELKKKGIEQDPAVHILTSQYANGLAVSHSDFFQDGDFAFMLDLLAERIKALGYKTANSDLLIRDKADYTESVEKHYLKPIIVTDPPFDQKFGNILVESVRIDDKPSYFKLSANVYSDRLYGDALIFDDLINQILN